MEYNPFITPKRNSTISKKMTFLKRYPIQPSNIKLLSFDPRKVYFRLLASGKCLQRKWLLYSVDNDNKSMYCKLCVVLSTDKIFLFLHWFNNKH